MRYLLLMIAGCLLTISSVAIAQNIELYPTYDFTSAGQNNAPQVVAYGVDLYPPYSFTGVGQDTLCLIGRTATGQQVQVPYCPYRQPLQKPVIIPDEVRRTSYAQYELIQKALAEPTPVEMIAVLLASFLVKDARANEGGLEITWQNGIVETVAYRSKEPFTPQPKLELHQELISAFKELVSNGRQIEFDSRGMTISPPTRKN